MTSLSFILNPPIVDFFDRQPTIYRFKKLKKIPPDRVRSCQRVGSIWSEILSTKKSNPLKISSLMGRLGVAEVDIEAQKILVPLMKEVCKEGVQIEPHHGKSGVYFISTKEGKRIAVFKVGEKRACTELAVREIAHRIGLEKHAVPGVMCTIANPTFTDDPITAELWKGYAKVYKTDSKNYKKEVEAQNLGVKEPYTLTGILEPFIDSTELLTVPDLARMTLLAVILGFRDIKDDGMSGSTFFDHEDCMPARFLPTKLSPESTVAALHLPYLKNPLAKEPLAPEILDDLISIVDRISVDDLASYLESLKIKFADLRAEQLAKNYEDQIERLVDQKLNLSLKGETRSRKKVEKNLTYAELKKLDNWGWDDGNCPVQIEKLAKILEVYPQVDVESDQYTLDTNCRMFSNEQIEALKDRLNRLKSVLYSVKHGIEEKRKETPEAGANDLPCLSTFEIVSNVDPNFGAYIKNLIEQGCHGDPIDWAGFCSPKSTRTRFSDDDRKWVAQTKQEIVSPVVPAVHILSGRTRAQSAILLKPLFNKTNFLKPAFNTTGLARSVSAELPSKPTPKEWQDD